VSCAAGGIFEQGTKAFWERAGLIGCIGWFSQHYVQGVNTSEAIGAVAKWGAGEGGSWACSLRCICGAPPAAVTLHARGTCSAAVVEVLWCSSDRHCHCHRH
jgi:hypothetical protein